jgi:putative tryptophan/tyrosine transport system substrate-binding protein
MKNNLIQFIILIITYCSYSEKLKIIPKIAIVQSYEFDYYFVVETNTGIIKGLVQYGYFENINVIIHRYYMNTKTINITPEQKLNISNDIINQLTINKYDAIITCDDNAFSFVALRIKHLGVPVIFSSINTSPERYNKTNYFFNTREKPGLKYTGVVELEFISNNIKLFKIILPELNGNKVVCFYDNTETCEGIKEYVDKDLAKHNDLNVTFQDYIVNNYSEMIQIYNDKVLNDPSVKVFIPFIFSLKFDEKTYWKGNDITYWSTKNVKLKIFYFLFYFIFFIRIPDIPLTNGQTKDGLFGGYVCDVENMGFIAGSYAGRILDGDNPSDLPIINSISAISLNLNRAKNLGIKVPQNIISAAKFVYETIEDPIIIYVSIISTIVVAIFLIILFIIVGVIVSLFFIISMTEKKKSVKKK